MSVSQVARIVLHPLIFSLLVFLHFPSCYKMLSSPPCCIFHIRCDDTLFRSPASIHTSLKISCLFFSGKNLLKAEHSKTKNNTKDRTCEDVASHPQDVLSVTGLVSSNLGHLLNFSGTGNTSKSKSLSGGHTTESHLWKVFEVHLLTRLGVNARKVRAGHLSNRSANSDSASGAGHHRCSTEVSRSPDCEDAEDYNKGDVEEDGDEEGYALHGS
mmetsp:Transcript_31674/g.77241  ORF Transcript_31674/g.77241 Transcript_31674/m.77241 type:complete len:214 (-) Transcript_31674:72-713(-)